MFCSHGSYALAPLVRIGHTVTSRPPPPPKRASRAGALVPRKFSPRRTTHIHRARGHAKVDDEKCLDIFLPAWYNGKMENSILKGLEGFEPFGRPSSGTGVYLLLAKGEVLYVGKSLNIFHRIGQHVISMRRHLKGKRPNRLKEELPFIEFDQVMVKWVPIAQIDGEEMKLIQRFLPEHNDLLKRTFIDVSNIPSVAKLIKDAPRTTSLMHGNAPGQGVNRRRAA